MRVITLLLMILLIMPACRQATTGNSDGSVTPPGQEVLSNKVAGTIQPNLEVDKMGKVLMIIAQNNFRDEELEIPERILHRAGYEVDIASITTHTAKGMMGTRVHPRLAVKDANPSEYEYVVVIGGAGSPELAEHEEVISVLKKAKRVAAICLGPMVLAKAGILSGKNATVFKTMASIAALEEGGAYYEDAAVVVDGDTITANGPEAADEFGKKLLENLEADSEG